MTATEEVQSTAPTEPEAVKTLPPLVMHEPTKLPTKPEDPGYWIRVSHAHHEGMKANPLQYVH